MIRWQKADPTLDKIRAMVVQEHGDYEEHDGILYRNFKPSMGEETTSILQLVLPKHYRRKILEVAHDIPLAGHLGQKKMLNRILQRFFWPGITREVRQYCRSCAACQKAATKNRKVCLQSMPIIDEPFSRIAMDIIGPLDRSKNGNVDAEATSGAITEVFTRFGIPREVLTDQGSNFMSELLGKVFRLVDISNIKTSPYHPQTDGLVERFNGTLKMML